MNKEFKTYQYPGRSSVSMNTVSQDQTETTFRSEMKTSRNESQKRGKKTKKGSKQGSQKAKNDEKTIKIKPMPQLRTDLKRPRKMHFSFEKRHKCKKQIKRVLMDDEQEYFEFQNQAQKLYYCDCPICMRQEKPHLKRILNPDDMSSEDQINIEKTEQTIQSLFKDKGYVFLLKMLSSVEETRGINVPVPQIMVFSQGRAVTQISYRDKEVKVYSPKDGFTNLDVRKLFIDSEFKQVSAAGKKASNVASAGVPGGVSMGDVVAESQGDNKSLEAGGGVSLDGAAKKLMKASNKESESK